MPPISAPDRTIGAGQGTPSPKTDRTTKKSRVETQGDRPGLEYNNSLVAIVLGTDITRQAIARHLPNSRDLLNLRLMSKKPDGSLLPLHLPVFDLTKCKDPHKKIRRLKEIKDLKIDRLIISGSRDRELFMAAMKFAARTTASGEPIVQKLVINFDSAPELVSRDLDYLVKHKERLAKLAIAVTTNQPGIIPKIPIYSIDYTNAPKADFQTYKKIYQDVKNSGPTLSLVNFLGKVAKQRSGLPSPLLPKIAVGVIQCIGGFNSTLRIAIGHVDEFTPSTNPRVQDLFFHYLSNARIIVDFAHKFYIDCNTALRYLECNAKLSRYLAVSLQSADELNRFQQSVAAYRERLGPNYPSDFRLLIKFNLKESDLRVLADISSADHELTIKIGREYQENLYLLDFRRHLFDNLPPFAYLKIDISTPSLATVIIDALARNLCLTKGTSNFDLILNDYRNEKISDFAELLALYTQRYNSQDLPELYSLRILENSAMKTAAMLELLRIKHFNLDIMDQLGADGQLVGVQKALKNNHITKTLALSSKNYKVTRQNRIALLNVIRAGFENTSLEQIVLKYLKFSDEGVFTTFLNELTRTMPTVKHREKNPLEIFLPRKYPRPELKAEGLIFS